MSRIGSCFSRLDAAGRKGLITFITAGDPNVDETPGLMHALVRGGADIIELGVPFSDPMADGEVIQRASERALSHGTSLNDVLDCVARFRLDDNDTPVVLMGYLNPFERMGSSVFAARAAASGVDGVLVVDLPPEEADVFNNDMRVAGIDQVFLVAPNSSVDRIRKVCEYASGFVYFVSVKGVTGSNAVAFDDIEAGIRMTRDVAGIPVGIGFGIRTPAGAAAAAAVADAIIVGSAIVELIAAGGDAVTAVERYVRTLREAIGSGAGSSA